MCMAGNGRFTWIKENPEPPIDQSPALEDNIYRPRRSHNKSRSGCQGCKQRRIKCDESKPKCGQCLYRKVKCEFLNTVSQRPASSISSNSAGSSTFRSSATAQILAYLEETDIPCLGLKDLVYKQGDGLELIDHFHDTTIPWLASSKLQRILQKEGIRLALGAPYLLHSILAISARHLSFLHPEQKKYEVTATIHYQHALTSYSSQLQLSLDAENVDTVIGCGYLQTMLAFENVSRSSKEADGGDGAIAWLRAMQGIKSLLNSYSICPHLEQSIWLPVFLESGGWEENTCQHTDEADDSWASNTSRSLHSLCGVPFDSSRDENPYQQPLKVLCQLMHSGESHETIGRFMVFIGKLPHEFVQLFKQKDPRAMLLMAYWCALICGVDQWWIVPSATFKCRGICASLDQVADSQIRDLLMFPASKCGYLLKN
ncbi:hypothetical protein BKA64DRAFT_607727 [Cadophora sp. MPI-SDFR-AT-0126]|nr:hypothetical protein BKA64DRAFT_607727 [Leotiomycetes sp. MPI-SDFR-AT-0126]